MAEEPATRISRFAIRLEQIERTLIAADIDPAEPDSRKQFGEDFRKLRDLLERHERRSKWLAGSAATVAAGIVTALATAYGPAIARAIAQGLMGK